MPDVGLLTPGAHLAPGSPASVTDDVAVVWGMVWSEFAWVGAQADLGLVPETTAEAVVSAIEQLFGGEGSLDDPAVTDSEDALALASEVAREAAETGDPVLPLVRRLRAALPDGVGPEVADAIHTGLSRRDVVDTALMLVLRDATALVRADLARARESLVDLARTHRSTPVLARTHTMAAVPTTFGARAATWLQAVAEADERLAAEAELLPVAYGGRAGTLDRVPAEHRFDLVEAWADRLGLIVTAAPWHVTRQPVERASAALAGVCSALGKVASDVLAGVRPEVGELAEPQAAGRGAVSSVGTPVLSVLLRRSALAAPPLLAQVVTAAGLAADDGADGAWHAEWPALQDLTRHATASAHTGAELCAGLVLDTEAAARNLARQSSADRASGDGTGARSAPPLTSPGAVFGRVAEMVSGKQGAADRNATWDTGAAEEIVDRVLDRYAAN